MTRSQQFCSYQSSVAGEPLIGTAPYTEVWFLLEYPFQFSPKAFEQSDLPEEVKDHLNNALKASPHSRLALIKKDNISSQSGYDFFIAISTPDLQKMYRFHFNDYSDLPSLDILSVLSENTIYQNYIEGEPQFLVCTNGKRDPCCAKYGLPINYFMNGYAHNSVWQSSHLGGHRFAANVVCLPHGVYYGRIPVHLAETVIDRFRQGQILPEYYRGRACFSPEQQSAEYYLRIQTGKIRLDDFKLVKSTKITDTSWQFVFISKEDKEYRVAIRSALSDFTIFESCSSPEKLIHQKLYHLEEISW